MQYTIPKEMYILVKIIKVATSSINLLRPSHFYE